MLDEARAFCAQALDDMPIVHDLVADIDGRAKAGKRLFDDVDRADHAGAESPRLRKHHTHWRGLVSGNGQDERVEDIRISAGVSHHCTLADKAARRGVRCGFSA